MTPPKLLEEGSDLFGTYNGRSRRCDFFKRTLGVISEGHIYHTVETNHSPCRPHLELIDPERFRLTLTLPAPHLACLDII